jgi:hypothetical protein
VAVPRWTFQLVIAGWRPHSSHAEADAHAAAATNHHFGEAGGLETK